VKPSLDFEDFKRHVRQDAERFLDRAFDAYADTPVRQAARYTALGGGHRWRAMVAIAAGRIFHPQAYEVALPFGCGVELAHAASLVLDDLPSMDDAQLRRGKPCAHRVFPRWAIDMAPVFLVTMAYQISLDNPLATAERRVAAALDLCRTGQEMIAGQTRDVTNEACDEAQLWTCYRLKSGALYASAAKSGAVLCGAGAAEAETLYQAGMSLGLSYQLLDDVADVIAGASEVGKDGGKDEGKPTAVAYWGVEGARTRSLEHQEAGLGHLAAFGPQAQWLRDLVVQASYAPA
jgi:geranylgeranyl pyrophosphate synthase